MVAYSFKPQFIDPILSGRKHQTIRGVGRRRHARGGEKLQLYTGMRTKACRLIGRATCIEAVVVTLHFQQPGQEARVMLGPRRVPLDLDLFAQQDGFPSWAHLATFWCAEHPLAFDAGYFDGLLIAWRDLVPA